MFIQLVGLPGSGKSAITAALAAHGPDYRQVPVVYRRVGELLVSRPLMTIGKCLVIGRFVPRALAAHHSALGPADRMAPLATLINLLVLYEDIAKGRWRDPASATPEPAGVFDEFVYQRAVGFLGTLSKPPSTGSVHAFVRCFWRYPAVPVFIEADADLALARASARPDGLPRRLVALDESIRRELYLRQAQVIEVLLALHERPIVVRNDGSPAEAAASIADRLETQLKLKRSA